jgi:hypothetical protein
VGGAAAAVAGPTNTGGGALRRCNLAGVHRLAGLLGVGVLVVRTEERGSKLVMALPVQTYPRNPLL